MNVTTKTDIKKQAEENMGIGLGIAILGSLIALFTIPALVFLTVPWGGYMIWRGIVGIWKSTLATENAVDNMPAKL